MTVRRGKNKGNTVGHDGSKQKSKKSGGLFDPAENRDRVNPEEKLDAPGQSHHNFNLVVDNVPYVVSAIAYKFNDESRFRVSINGNEEHVFTWDSDLKRLKAIDDEASTLPDDLEEAISTKLQSKS